MSGEQPQLEKNPDFPIFKNRYELFYRGVNFSQNGKNINQTEYFFQISDTPCFHLYNFIYSAPPIIFY
jgi:hypothetical protein